MSSKFSKSSTITAVRHAIANKLVNPTMSAVYAESCNSLEQGKFSPADEKDCLVWLNNVLDGIAPRDFEQICRRAERRAERDAENAVTGFSNY